MKQIFALVVISLLIVGCAPKRIPVTDISRLSAAQRTELDRVLAVGKEIYRKDQLAAKATDVLLERLTLPDDGLGWLVHREGGVDYVSFFRGDIDSPTLYADVIYDGKPRPTIIENPSRKPGKTELSMLLARYVGYYGFIESRKYCTQTLNTVVLPSHIPDAWDVYVMSATSEPDKIVVGGHARMTIAVKDGEPKFIEAFPFGVSCLIVPNSSDQIPVGAKPVGIMVSHIVSDLPSETHVFLSYLHNTEIIVTTKTATLGIKNGRLIIHDILQTDPSQAASYTYPPYTAPIDAH